MIKYASDHVLQPQVDGVCGHCFRFGKPVFPYNGFIVDPAKAARPRQAMLDPFVSHLCATCIDCDNTAKHAHQVAQLGRVAEPESVERAEKAFHQLPDLLNSSQDVNWPFCCDDFCEWFGTAVSKEGIRAWENQNNPSDAPRESASCDHAEPAPRHLFRCRSCQKAYTTEHDF